MTKVQLNISEDEIRDLLTKLYHESGYYVEKTDPIVIEYMMHKIILRQYEEHFLAQTKYFLNEFLPYLNETNANFESKKAEFVAQIEKRQKETLETLLKSVTEACQKKFDKTAKDACQLILDNLERMSSYLHERQERVLDQIDPKYTRFRTIAEKFEEYVRWGAYVVGGSAILASLTLGVCTFLYLR